MKRRHLGWPPNSSVKRAMAHAREIERAIAEADRKPTSADLQASIASKISRPQWVLLEQLIRLYPAPLTREDLAKAANVSAASSGFEKNVSTLSGFGFVEYPVRGSVAASPICFVE